MTPEQLRASILQYAMEGKLVKQNPADEPASELLEKIERKKDELVKEGKIKKSKKLPTITEGDKPFVIPDKWEWARLSDIARKITDGTHNPPPNSHTGKQVISAKNIKNGKIDFSLSDRFVTETQFAKEDKRTHIRRGDVLLTIVGSLGNAAVVETDKLFTTQRSVAVIDSDLLSKYLYYSLISGMFQKQVFDNAKGTSQKGIYLKKLSELLLPIPPLEEQKRIVAKIEKLMPLVDEYAESYNRLQKIDNEFEDKLKQSVLQYAMEGKLVKQDPSDEPASELIKKIKNEKAELIKEGKIKKSKKLPVITDDEKPFDIPDSWEWIRLGDYAEKITDEVASGSFAAIRDNVRKYKTENYAIMVKTADFANHFSKNLTYTDEHGYNFLNNSNLFGGELILSNIGSIGKCFIVPKLNRPMTLAPNSIMTKLIDPKLNKFLYYFIKSPIGNFELLQIASGTTMKKFNKTNLKGILIPIPPLNEQKRIVFEIEKIVNSIDKLSK